MSEFDDLRNRRAAIEVQDAAIGADKRGGTTKKLAATAGVAALLAGGWFLYDSLSTENNIPVAIPTSQTTEFPEDRNAGANLELPKPVDPVIIEREVFTAVPDSAALSRLQELEAELEQAREALESGANETARERDLRTKLEAERAERDAEIRSLRSAAQNDQERMSSNMATLKDQVTTLRRDMESATRTADTARMDAETAATREKADLQRTISQNRLDNESDRQRMVQDSEAERQAIIFDYEARLNEALGVDEAEADRIAAEKEQRQRVAALRAEMAAKKAARINSSLLALNNSGSNEAGAQEPRELSLQESFVRRNVEPVPVAASQTISNPESTVIQGSIIQASLEVAIDSSLPGQIRAVISEDVHSMDGSRVLIPAGSKVFGEYSNGIETGQRRVLIAWTRIVTTNNQAVDIASYGADSLGRSGTAGAVDTHFASRFGGAALISIISAAPALLAQNVENTDTASAIDDVGSEFGGATQNAMSDVLSMPPSIYVRQGEQVTIIVDRDLEFT